LFVAHLKKMMHGRKKPMHLVLDGLPAHKTALVKAYVASTKGRLTLHFLPGYDSRPYDSDARPDSCERAGNGPCFPRVCSPGADIVA
jgi:hypothetical protein